jgi:hypothetical protein
MPNASLSDIMHFFGYERAAEFTKEWKQLTADDQAQIKAGIGDGTFTY